MISPLRVIDTGEKPARWNIAMTAALTELHRSGRIPDTLRFHRYPASVLVGRHQVLAQAAHLDNCREAGIELARRITGGGAVYMAPSALAWDLVIARNSIVSQGRHVGSVVGEAIAAGLARLGLPARYRWENEVEVGGRKVCGMSGYFDGGSLVYQGTILADTDLTDMTRFLRLPTKRKAKLPRDLRERLTTVADILGRKPDEGEIESAISAGISHALCRMIVHDATADEEAGLADEWHRAEFGLDSFVTGVSLQSTPNTIVGRDGHVDAYIQLRPGEEHRIDQIWLTGNFTMLPARALPDLEAALRGLPVHSAPDKAIEILSTGNVQMLGASRHDVAGAIANARATRTYSRRRM